MNNNDDVEVLDDFVEFNEFLDNQNTESKIENNNTDNGVVENPELHSTFENTMNMYNFNSFESNTSSNNSFSMDNQNTENYYDFNNQGMQNSYDNVGGQTYSNNVEFNNIEDNSNTEDKTFETYPNGIESYDTENYSNNIENQNVETYSNNMQNESSENYSNNTLDDFDDMASKVDGFNSIANTSVNNTEDNVDIANFYNEQTVNNSESVSTEGDNAQYITESASESHKKEDVENPIVEMVNNKSIMKFIVVILIILFIAVAAMPKVLEMLKLV